MIFAYSIAQSPEFSKGISFRTFNNFNFIFSFHLNFFLIDRVIPPRYNISII